jgi:hypothetical protein
MAVNAGMMFFLLVLQPRLEWIPAFGPWPELARIVEQHEDQLQSQTGKEPLIIGDGKYRLASVLAFYRKSIEMDGDAASGTTSRWVLDGEGLGFPYWFQTDKWNDADCIYVSNSARDDIAKQVGPYFDSVEVLSDPRLKHLGRKGFGIAICRGLRTEKPAIQDAKSTSTVAPLILPELARIPK